MAEPSRSFERVVPTPEAGLPADPPPPGPDPAAAFHARRWKKHKWIAFLVGGLAGGLAGFANTAYGLTFGLPVALYDEGLFILLLVAVIAPLVEEHVKILSLILLRAEEKARYTPRRWMVLGALSGAGFGVAEALLYWQAIAPLSIAAANLNLLVRAFLTVPLHALTTATSGYGFGLSRLEGRVWPLARGLIVAILIHAAFNAFQTLPVLGAWP